MTCRLLAVCTSWRAVLAVDLSMLQVDPPQKDCGGRVGHQPHKSLVRSRASVPDVIPVQLASFTFHCGNAECALTLKVEGQELKALTVHEVIV